MTPERWQQIEKLYHAALEREDVRRGDFLDEACAGDNPLRWEVEHLIGAYEPAGNFMEGAPKEVWAGSLTTDRNGQMTGGTLGNSNLAAPLAEAGMVKFYLLTENKLGRKWRSNFWPGSSPETAKVSSGSNKKRAQSLLSIT